MKITITIILFLISFLLSAQVDHLARFEIEHNTDAQDYIIVSNDRYGLLLVTPRYQGTTKEYPIELQFLDSNLKRTWNEKISVEKRFILRGYHYVDKISYLLFQNRTNNNSTKIIRVDPQNQEVKQFEPMNIVDLTITEFEMIKSTAILGGYYQERPVVFAYDLEINKIRTLSNVYQKNSELLEVKVNADSVTFNVIASKQTENKDRTFIVSTYDFGGNAIRDYELEIPEDYQLLTGVSSSIRNKEQVIVGLYCVDIGNYPSGLFVNHVDRTGVQNMKFYNFGQFDSFLNHTGKRADKLKGKALAAAESNKVWRFKTDGLFKELLEEDHKLVFVGEFYRPWSLSTLNYQRFKNENRISNNNTFMTNPMLNPALRTNPRHMNFTNGVENEINYTHAFALGLDYKGNILWDGSMEIDETIEGDLHFLGDFLQVNGETFYAYYYDELLVASHLCDREDSNPYANAIQLLNESDELRHERDVHRGIVRWYNNKFLIHGIQHVRDDYALRKVFFINAVSMKKDFPSIEINE